MLSTAHWPAHLHRAPDARLPPEMAAAQEAFARFHRARHPSHALKWQLGLGEVVVVARFGGAGGAVVSSSSSSSSGGGGASPRAACAYDMHVTPLQAIALRAFDGEPGALSFPTLQTRTGMAPAALQGVLHSLACMKIKALVKAPDGLTVAITDTFAVNTRFSHRFRTFRVPAPAVVHDGESPAARPSPLSKEVTHLLSPIWSLSRPYLSTSKPYLTPSLTLFPTPVSDPCFRPLFPTPVYPL